MSTNIDEQSDPSENYAAPARTFRGTELKPYSDGNKMLLAMITREGDPNSLFLFALLYVLTQPRAVVQKATANKDQVRLDVLAWLDDLHLTPDEFESAQNLAVSILQEAIKNKVDPIAAGAAGNASAPAV